MVDQATAPPAVAIWQIEILPSDGQRDRAAEELKAEAADMGLLDDLQVRCSRGFLLQGELSAETVDEIARTLLTEPVVERAVITAVGQGDHNDTTLHVLPIPGVTDSQAETALAAMQSLGYDVEAVGTYRKFQIANQSDQQVQKLAGALLFNEAIEQVVYGPLDIQTLVTGQATDFQLQIVPLLNADDDQLQKISSEGGLSLTLVEMQTIQKHFQTLQRDPTDIELETVAQTWSEHCSHKTLAGKIEYSDGNETRHYDNMLKETIFAATQTIRAELGDSDWCISVFKDNAGIVAFDDEMALTFKVETHNRPSALEPYGGANTGIGGVIRDTLGTGMGAKPICNTDVFCFAPPTMSADELPPGVLHPRRIMKGVVSGVRDYGNRMGIPTVNGAVYFDERYVGNPLVFCGNVGLIPNEMAFKEPQDGDLIVTIGGRTGRDGIHGATFSSAELTEHSEVTSGGSVQIGNAITEKMVADVLLQARDRNLYSAVTDCGAGGFSSAVGEMGEELGAVVWLEKAPLKYKGLSYTEIWISEAQERMVFAVPEENWPEFEKLCSNESVEATVIGKFEATGNLKLTFDGQEVGNMAMSFLHDGRPEVVRKATYSVQQPAAVATNNVDGNETLLKILASPNVASKHWIIRQYDHEVLAGSVVKPLVGLHNDGPSDAAVIRPRLNSRRGIAVSCGMNPYFGDLDPYHMAQSSIDEAVRNCVAVGADPSRIAILDNFCWGYTDRPETLGSLVRAAIGCQDLAIQLKTPFISGKDSLNNEFSYSDPSGNRTTISIPSTLLISALGQVPSVDQCTTMDLKSAGNHLYIVGVTRDEMGGSHCHVVNDLQGGSIPKVDAVRSNQIFHAMHKMISSGLARSVHDLSEGGLALAVSEMAFAGGLGVDVDLATLPIDGTFADETIGRLFSESNTRFVCEVEASATAEFESIMGDLPHAKIGEVNDSDSVRIQYDSNDCIHKDIRTLKETWQAPLDWS